MALVRTIVSFVVIVLSATATLAQVDPIFARLEKTVERQQPNWSLVHKRITPNGNVGLYEWKRNGSLVTALIYATASQEAAAGQFQDLPEFLNVTKSTETIPNLGDANYVWTRDPKRTIDGNVGVAFRKGRFVIHVAANSLDDAKLFAQLLANEAT